MAAARAPAKKAAKKAAKTAAKTAATKVAKKTTSPLAERPPRLVAREVTAARWPDFERLFEAKGSPSYCWCMAWRATAEEVKTASGHAARKKLMKARIADGTPVGLLGYLAGEPVAWVSVAPRPTHRGLVKDPDDSQPVWSVVCFFVRREHRGEGLTKALLDAAVKHAKKRGARIVEGYPVDPDSPSYRFMGFVPLFKDAGFHETGRAGTRRHVMQLPVSRRR